MQTLKRFIQNLTISQLTILALILCLPAFLISLGTVAFIGDESIRTLVALEMKLSGNFIVPTLNGAEYFNKPPLFNWFVYLMSSLFGYYGEWPTRMTSLIFLGVFALSVYHYTRKQFDSITSLTLALMVLTSGRILFWDSMLGLIDICFSWIIYLNFMVLYYLGKAQRWKSFFIASYLLFSIAFLLKGLPAIVFQGLSMLTALQLHRALKKKLFSVDHFLGIGIGILPVVLYYIAYATHVSLEHVFGILTEQSLKRTVTHHSIWKTTKHLFTFPLEQFYNFLPWTLLVITFFHPRFRTWLKENDFVRFNFWMLIVNIPVYWISAQVYARYLLMFIPLFNMVGYYILERSRETHQRWWNIFRYSFILLIGLSLLAVLLMPIEEKVRSMPGIHFIWIGGSLGLGFCLLSLYFDSKRIFYWRSIALLVFRIVFDGVVLPIRAIDHPSNVCREDCKRVAAKFGDSRWYLYGETFPHEVARFYTSGYTHQIILHTNTATDQSAFYLVDRKLYPDFPGLEVDTLILEDGHVISLMKPKP